MEIGTTLSNTYRILKQIGQGGNGTVYLAVHQRTCQLWAVKEVRGNGRELSSAEVTYWKHFSHPGLPRVIDVLEEAEFLYFIMDYIRGKTLKEILEQEGAQRKNRILDWGEQLCRILEYLHSRTPSIIYGDLKPENVICEEEGKLKLIDFGTARAHPMEGIVEGTMAYASPEQLEPGSEIDPRTDIYSLGVLLLELYRGKQIPPEERETETATSGNLARVLKKCLKQAKEDRYDSCRNLRKAMLMIRRKHRWCCLGLSLTSFVFLLAGNLWEEHRETLQQEHLYETYLKSSSISEIQSAIFLDPTREEAYQKLLQFILLDNQMDAEEDLLLRSILAETELEFMSNQTGYHRFAYEAGFAYWYYFEGTGNKKFAAHWFQKLEGQEGGRLEPEMVERAKVMARIGTFYDNLDKRTRTGEGEIIYDELWRDLESLLEKKQRVRDEGITTLLMCSEIAGILCTYLKEFQEYGVPEEAVRSMAEQIEDRMEGVGKEMLEQGAGRTLAEGIGIKLELIKTSADRIYEMNR